MGNYFKHFYTFLSLDELRINMYMDRYNVIVKVILFITHFGKLPCLKKYIYIKVHC